MNQITRSDFPWLFPGSEGQPFNLCPPGMEAAAHRAAIASLLADRLETEAPTAILQGFLSGFRGRVAILSSFGAESAVLLHIAAQIDPAVPILFLDTGWHFPETIAHRDALLARLGLTGLRELRPSPAEAARRDPDRGLWASAPDACCALRKVRPLDEALPGFDVLIDGRKRHHGAARGALPVVREEEGQLRVSPLVTWSAAEIEAHRQRHELPSHPLAARGYASVGCLPCTSPVRPGEDARAGRWRGTGKTECGIHRR